MTDPSHESRTEPGATTFEVVVGDNFHHGDADEQYSAGSYSSYEQALARAKGIVDASLRSAYEPGMTSSELYESYMTFGEDPFIVPTGEPRFSAWDYASERCRNLCADEDALLTNLRFPSWPTAVAGFEAVIRALLGRPDLDEAEHTFEALLQAIENYPNGMPRPDHKYWLRIEQGDAAFTVYLFPDRFELSAGSVRFSERAGKETMKVDWTLRFRGSGRRDRREGDPAVALEAMRQAAENPDSLVKARS